MMNNLDEFYDRAIQYGPSSDTLFEVLSRLKAAGRLTRVVQECVRALAKDPDHIPLRKLLAETYFELDILSQAEVEVESVISRLDRFVSAYKLRASIYQRQNRDEESARALKLYLAHRPDDADALHLLETLGVPEEGLAHGPAAVEPAPRALGAANGKKPFASEERLGEEFPVPEGETFPEIATPTLAEIYFSQGQIPEAINTYEMVLAQDPQDESSRQRLEELKAMMGPTETPLNAKETDGERAGKEKTITVLEAWLAGIRKMTGTAPPH